MTERAWLLVLSLALSACPTPGQAGGAEVDVSGFSARVGQLCQRGVGDPSLCARRTDAGTADAAP